MSIKVFASIAKSSGLTCRPSITAWYQLAECETSCGSSSSQPSSDQQSRFVGGHRELRQLFPALGQAVAADRVERSEALPCPFHGELGRWCDPRRAFPRVAVQAALTELATWVRLPDATAWNVVRWAEGRKS